MNRTDSKMNLNSSIEQAEEAVQHSINRFETAMEHLAEKVEGTSQKLHHVRDVAKDSKDKLLHLKDEVQATLDPVKPYVKQIKNASGKALGTVRSAPKPYLWLAAGVIGYAAYKYFKGSAQVKPNHANDFSTEYTSEFPYQ